MWGERKACKISLPGAIYCFNPILITTVNWHYFFFLGSLYFRALLKETDRSSFLRGKMLFDPQNFPRWLTQERGDTTNKTLGERA